MEITNSSPSFSRSVACWQWLTLPPLCPLHTVQSTYTKRVKINCGRNHTHTHSGVLNQYGSRTSPGIKQGMQTHPTWDIYTFNEECFARWLSEHPSKQKLLPFYVTSLTLTFSFRGYNFRATHTENRDQSNQCAAEINDKLQQTFPLGLHICHRPFSSSTSHESNCQD